MMNWQRKSVNWFLDQSESESSRMQGLKNSKLGIESTAQSLDKLSKMRNLK